MQLSRRGALAAFAAGGALVVGWALTPRRFGPPLPAAEGETVFDGFIRIGRDGVVGVTVPGLEMGQGISTLLPQIVAAELGADWRQIAVVPAPVSGAYGDAVLAARWAPLWLPLAPAMGDRADSTLAHRFAEIEPLMATAEGTALASFEAPLRAAAASARALLAKAAARGWGVGWEECEVAGGFVAHAGKRARFGDLAAAAAGERAPDPAVLRPAALRENPAEFPPGSAPRFPRLDLPAKVDGRYQFAADIRLPDMRFAAIRHAPLGDARLGHHDAGAIHVPGFERLVTGADWVAAVGESWWAAERALSLIAPRFHVGQRADTAAIFKALDHALLYGAATPIVERGDPARWFASGPFEASAHHTIYPALPAPLETASATARVRDGRIELWLGSQAPAATRRAVAAALGVGEGAVVVIPVGAGGSFDSRLEHDHAVEAALIARDIGHPVQLTWSRWEEQLACRPRMPARAALAARTAPDGTLAALKLRIAAPASMRELGARLFSNTGPRAALARQDQPDPLVLAGGDVPYAIDTVAIEHVPAAINLPTGRVRGGGAALTCYLLETFIDELAAQAGREPLSYRMAMLGEDPRLAECLQRAASLAQWSGGGGGSGQGLACHRMRLGGPDGADRTGRIALIVSARRDEHGIRVDRMTAVADIGGIVNVDLARQQIEGGLIYGIGLATGSSTAYLDGLPLTARLGMMGLPLLADCPEIEVEFLASEAEPFDPGELGCIVAAPAMANALWAAGGLRARSLPLGADQD